MSRSHRPSAVHPPASLSMIALLAVAVLALAAPAAAAEELADHPAFSLSPERLLTAARSTDESQALPEGSAVEILFQSTVFSFRENGAAAFSRHEVYRILTSEGAELWNEISIDYSPWYQGRPTLRARVITPAGRVHTLDPDTISEISLESDMPDVYQDRRRLVAPLPAVEKGAVVETLVELRDDAPLFDAGTVHRVPLASPVPMRLVRVTVDRPESLPLRHLVAQPVGADPASRPEPTVARADGRIREVFEARPDETIGYRPVGLPPEETHYPYVAFTTGRSWQEVARAYHGIVDRQVEASDLGNVDVPGEELPSQWEQIAARVAWMQSAVRYTGINLGEAAIVPRPPAQTLARRYGDCKDKATLLVAALRELGIPAYVALLRAGSPDDIDPEMPGLGAGGFDHVIVYVPGTPALWIDATDPYSALGELPAADQGRLALIASPNTERLIRTPVTGADDNRISETREVFLPELGKGRVVETSELHGAAARELRGYWATTTEEEIVDSLAAYAEGEYGTASATGVEHTPADDLSGPVTSRLEVEEAAWAVTDLVQGLVAIPRTSLLQRMPYAAFWQPEEGEERPSDFVVDEPHSVTWQYRIHVPEGFAPRELPEDDRREMGPAVYTARFEQVDREVRATLEMRLDARRLTPEELAALRQGVEDLGEEGNLLLWFDQTAARHAAAGRMNEAFEEIRRLMALHPDEALHRVQLAQTALTAGLVEEARLEARKAVELEPDWYVAYQALGLTLLHDPAGRQFRPGFDRAGALAAFERAHELDPTAVETSINLALLHENDAQGRRYQDPEELEKAVAIYREIQDDLKGTEHELNLPVALLWLGRPEEVRDLLKDGSDTAPRRALLAVAEALTDDPETAIRHVERSYPGDGATRARVLQSASQTLVAQRHYPEATALLRAASETSSNPARLQGMLRMIENARRWEEVVDDDPDSPVSLTYRLIALSKQGGPPTLSELRPFMADVWQDELENERLAEMVEEELSFAAPGGQAVPANAFDMALDMLFGLGNLVAAELPGIGWTIHLETDLPVPGSDKGIIVVRQDGTYRFAASEDQPATLGRYAFALTQTGKAEAARPWIERAYELTEPPEDWDTTPSAEGLFHQAWERREGVEPPSLEVAAAMLSSEDFGDEAVIEVLRRARSDAPEGDRRIALDHALARALLGRDEPEELLEVGLRIFDTTDEDFYASIALRRLERYDDLLELYERTAKKTSDEDLLATARVNILMDQGKLDEAAKAFTQIMAGSDPPSFLYNSAAWLAVARGAVDERALEWARQAVEESDYESAPELHTLAAAFAQAGQPKAAYQVMLQAMESRTNGEIEPYDWYVFGLIAEDYDFTEAARRYYQRVTAPEGREPHPTDTWTLAQRRLELLGKR